MSRISNKLRLAMEELDEEAGISGGGDGGSEDVVDVGDAGGSDDTGDSAEVTADDYDVSGDAESGDDTAEAAVADAGEAEAEVDAAEDATDQLEESAQGLEAIYDFLRDAQQKGGLSRQAAQAVSIAVEAYTKPLGYDEPIMPSLEHFGADAARLKATNLSLESVKETLKKAWEAVKKFIIKIWDKVVNFVKRLFSAAERLKQRGEKLSKIKLNGKAKNATIDAKGLARKVAIGTSAEMNAVKGMKGMNEIVKIFVDEAKDFAGSGLTKAIKELQGLANGTYELDAGEKAAAKRLNDFSQKLNGYTNVLPGNLTVKVRKLSLGADALSVTIPYLSANENEGRVSDKATVPTMDEAKIRAAGTAAVALYGSIQALKSAGDAVASGARSLKNVDVPDDMKDDNRKRFNTYMALTRQEASVLAGTCAKLASHAIKTGLAYLQLAERSAAQYKESKPSK